MVQLGVSPVHQPPIWRSQGLDEGVEGIVLPPVPAEISVEAVEGVVSRPRSALQILPSMGKAREDRVRESTNAEESERRNYETQQKTMLTDKRRIPLRSTSVRIPHLFHHGIPKVLVNPRSKGITSVRSTTTH
jgi:hypothetical protein